MGIQFTALDSSRTRPTFTGQEVPVRVFLPEKWEFFNFHAAGAVVLLGLLKAANTFQGRTLLAGQFADHQAGEVSVVDARRAILVARARFDLLAPSVVNAVEAVGAWLNRESRGGAVVLSGCDQTPEDLRRRLEEFAAFVEAAAAAGANLIAWS